MKLLAAPTTVFVIRRLLSYRRHNPCPNLEANIIRQERQHSILVHPTRSGVFMHLHRYTESKCGSWIEHKPQILSCTNVACERNLNVTYLVACLPPRTVEEGDIAALFLEDLGLALSPKKRPDQPGLQRGQR